MALRDNALTSLEVAKAHLGIPTAETSQDSRVELLINVASQHIETWTGRKLKSQNLVQVFDGRRQNALLPAEFPVTAVSSLAIDNSHAFGPSTEVTNYVISDGGITITLLDQYFPQGHQNIRLAYTAGYIVVPADLEYGCLLLIEWLYRFRSAQDIGRTSKNKGDESVGILQEIPMIVRQQIGPYKRLEVPGTVSPVGQM
jgi:hypothetical protein